MAAAVAAAAAPPRARAADLAPPARRDGAGCCYRQRLPGSTPHPLNGPPMPSSNGRDEGGVQGPGASHWLPVVPVREGVPREEEGEARPIAATEGGAWREERAAWRVDEQEALQGLGLVVRLPEGRVLETWGLRLCHRRSTDVQAQCRSLVSKLIRGPIPGPAGCLSWPTS